MIKHQIWEYPILRQTNISFWIYHMEPKNMGVSNRKFIFQTLLFGHPRFQSTPPWTRWSFVLGAGATDGRE